MTDKEKAIKWFENIADECDRLTSGNVAHLGCQIKGMALRSAEYLKKQELASEDLENAAIDYDNHGCVLYAEDEEGDIVEISNVRYSAFKNGANWQKEQIMKDAISGVIFGSRYFRQKNISLTELSEEQYDKLKDFGERIKVIIIKE